VEPSTTAYDKTPGSLALAQHVDPVIGKYKIYQEGRLGTMIEVGPASCLIDIHKHLDKLNRLRSLANTGNIMA